MKDPGMKIERFRALGFDGWAADVVTSTKIVTVCKGTRAEVEAATSKLRARLFRAGHAVIFADGSKVWRTREPAFSKGQLGGFDWHPDGERVRFDVVEIRVSADGERTERVVRSTWGLPG